MADVFVSYSRSDKEFVRELVGRLAGEGKEAWVDWEGIPPTAAWLEEIYAAIESSDAFLFVISLSSAASRICQEELTHAEKLGKRIVPVNFSAMDPSVLPPALAERQWITFGDGRPYDESLATLVEALDTDLDWVQRHTHWLGKAREWERSGRDKSFLLRGSELRSAEAWLTSSGAADKEPPATPLHSEYVLTSRQAATRRQRGFVTAISIALLVTIALAVAALLQRNRAISERKTAESELLANLSVQRLRTDLDTALLLGAAAYDIKRTPEAMNALLVGVHRTDRVQGLIRALPGTATAADLSGDGRILATAGGGKLAVWDLETRRRLAFTSTDNEVVALALTGDGSGLATIEGTRVVLYRTGADADGLEPWRPVPKALSEPVSLAFSPSRSLLAVGTNDGRIGLLDVEGGGSQVITTDRPREFEGRPMPIFALGFNAEGTRLAAGSPIGVHLVDVDGDARYRGLTELLGAVALAFVDQASSVAVVTGEGRLMVVDTDTGRRVCGPLLTGLTAVSAGEGRRLATGGGDGVIRLVTDPCKRPSDRLTGHGRAIGVLRFVGKNAALVSTGVDGLTVLWTPARSSLVQQVPGRGELASDVAWGSNENELVVADETGLWLHSPRATPRRLDGSPTRLSALASAPQAQLVAASSGDAVGIWRGADYSQEPRRRLPGHESVSLALSADGKALAAGSNRASVFLFDLGDDEAGARLPTGGSANVTALAFGAGDRLLAAGDNEGQVVAWDLSEDPSRRIVASSDTQSAVESLAFEPSGDLLAVGWTDGRLGLYDLGGGREIRLPARHRDSVVDLAFSSSGDELISAGEDGDLFVWDVESARPLGLPFPSGIAPIEGIDSTASSEVVAVLASYGQLALVQPTLWDAEEAFARVCAVVGRSLTEAERRTVASGIRIPETCSR